MNNGIVEYHGTPISTASQVVAQTFRVQEIMKAVMKKDVHYGIIPGTNKNTLYKPGAEILCASFHIAPTYDVTEERFDDGVRYRVKCTGIHQGTNTVIAEGLGSCSSHEEKYKWCKAGPREWGATDASRRRVQYGYNRAERKEYEIMQVRVETADIENTLLKMASKRAMIAMVLNAVAASDVFSQDFDDLSQKVIDSLVDDDDDTTPAMEEKAVADLLASLDEASTIEDLRAKLKVALGAAATAKDAAAHAKFKARGQERADKLKVNA